MSRASVKALEKQIFSGKMNSDKSYILKQIMEKDSTIESLQNILTLQYSTITGRLSDLENLGVIYVKHLNKDRRLSVYSYEAHEGRQSLNRADREKRRFLKWCKKAKDFGRFIDPYLIKEINIIKNSCE